MKSNPNLKLLVLKNDNNNENLNIFFRDLERYFFVDVYYCFLDNLTTATLQNYNFVIVENFHKEQILTEDKYQLINTLFPNSKIFWLLNKYNENSTFFLRNINNDILYYNENYEIFKISNLSYLKNYFKGFESGNFISHRSLFLDFVSNKFFYNNKILELTKKEFLVLSFLLHNRDSDSIDKNRIFRYVWDIENDTDNSRVVDQILHKLKKKINSSYFENILGKGTKII
ncbi:winged helix-turn-helix domain-containing protein [[Mycoplasma] mobile]|nr:winged helix-turn-helix domain-containing protein [[Mycoplasma] mobile]